MIYKFKSWIDINKINWSYLSHNENAVDFLENNLDKVNWDYLSENVNAVHILENNLDKVNWYYLSKNKNIFDYDYDKMKQITSIFKEELIATVFNPTAAGTFFDDGTPDGNMYQGSPAKSLRSSCKGKGLR